MEAQKPIMAIMVAFAFLNTAGIGQASETVTAGDVLSTFDPASPGRGADAYLAEESEHAMAYALFTSASLLNGDKERAAVGAEWLANNASPASGVTGWGLSFAWDAFSDGTENPAETVYGITTALAVRALMDSYDATKNKTHLDLARSALQYYQQFYTPTENGGFFWYSDQPQDAKDVSNVNAMLLGQYARVGAIVGDGEMVEIAQSAAANLMANQKFSDLGAYWSYSTENQRPNDLVHASYTVQGLLDLSAAVGSKTDLEDHLKYLHSFQRDDAIYEFAPHPDIQAALVERPARLWGVGALLYTMSDGGSPEEARRLLRLLEPYRVSEGAYSSTVGSEEIAPRMTAHLAWGLARMEMADRPQDDLCAEETEELAEMQTPNDYQIWDYWECLEKVDASKDEARS